MDVSFFGFKSKQGTQSIPDSWLNIRCIYVFIEKDGKGLGLKPPKLVRITTELEELGGMEIRNSKIVVEVSLKSAHKPPSIVRYSGFT